MQAGNPNDARHEQRRQADQDSFAKTHLCLAGLLIILRQTQGMNLLHMRERVEHHVCDEQKRCEQRRENKGCGTGEWVGSPVADAPVEFNWLEQHIPTVEAEETAEIDAEAAKPCGSRNEEPARQVSKDTSHNRLHQVEREKTQDQAGKRTGKD